MSNKEQPDNEKERHLEIFKQKLKQLIVEIKIKKVLKNLPDRPYFDHVYPM